MTGLSYTNKLECWLHTIHDQANIFTPWQKKSEEKKKKNQTKPYQMNYSTKIFWKHPQQFLLCGLIYSNKQCRSPAWKEGKKIYQPTVNQWVKTEVGNKNFSKARSFNIFWSPVNLPRIILLIIHNTAKPKLPIQLYLFLPLCTHSWLDKRKLKWIGQ